MMENYNISALIKKSITGGLTPQENDTLMQWINESDANKELYKKLTDTSFQMKKLTNYRSFNEEKVRERIEKQLFGRRKFLFTGQFYRYAAAVIIPLLIVGGMTFHFWKGGEMMLVDIDKDIKPGSQQATLILSDGSSLELKEDKVQAIKDRNIVISNQDSKLLYSQKKDTLKETLHEVAYNELRTPRGGKYKVLLADGTEVWLNAGSSLKYPVNFTDSIRQVFLTGEAYFDVSHNGKPFVVKASDINVRVLGTEFNVSAYHDEEDITTTLVEGKVAVNFNNTNLDEDDCTILTPGLQAISDKLGERIIVSKVNVSQYTSWVNGKLEFNNQNLDQVMRRLARWYDFEYSFDNESAKAFHFTARVDSEDKISEILEMLEMSTNVKFEIEDNLIVVK